MDTEDQTPEKKEAYGATIDTTWRLASAGFLFFWGKGVKFGLPMGFCAAEPFPALLVWSKARAVAVEGWQPINRG